MADVPASPPATRTRTPGWLDARVLVGLLLVLGSVVAGARVLATADRSQEVWAVTRDLAPGSVLGDGDLATARVRLFGNASSYVSAAGAKPTGYVLRRALGAGELLPAASVSAPGAEIAFRAVTLPVTRGHLPPDLRAGEQVDVYVTPDDRARSAAGPSPGTGSGAGPAAGSGPHLVLAGLTVLERPSDGELAGAGASEVPVVVQVAPADVLSLMVALSQGRLDLVQVPHSQESRPAGGGAVPSAAAG